MKETQRAKILPDSAVRWLCQAAQTPLTPVDPLARLKAIETATERIKRTWPQYFRNHGCAHGQNGSRQ